MSKDRNRITHYLEAAGWLLVAALLKVLPRCAEVLLADVLGWFVFCVVRMRRRQSLENLRIAFPEESESRRRQIALRSYQNVVLSFCEFIQREPFFGRGSVYVSPENEQHYRELIGQPVIVLTGHMGNWESMPEGVRPKVVQLVALAKPLHNPIIDRWANRGRVAHGVEIVPVTGSLKGVVDAVRHGKWLVLLGDQDAGRAGVFVDFFGRPASTATGPAVFSHKLNVPLLPVFSVRSRDARRTLRLVFAPAIRANPLLPREEEVVRVTTEHVKALESVIRAYPENYFWVHRRWKTKPKRRARTEAPPQ